MSGRYRKAPDIYSASWVAEYFRSGETQVCIDGKYIPARPLGFDALGHRLKLAFGVFTGKYDALKWPGGQ